MSGLLALLDDVVALTKVAASTIDDAASQAVTVGTKTTGVLIDDAAVTPRYVTGLAGERELPIIGRIALGSLRNKLVFLLPAALLLSAFLPGAITPLLMLGGLYLAAEGAEKIFHALAGDNGHKAMLTMLGPGPDAKALEDQRVAGAIRTDFILSAEIMAIALANITAPDLVTRALVLAGVGILVTLLVYGLVALIVKADDLGVSLARRGGPISGPLGRVLVKGVPPFLRLLSIVGTFAMLWVGGGILLHGLHEYGFTWPETVIHAVTEALHAAVPAGGDVLAWVAEALGAALAGLAAGAVAAPLLALLTAPFSKAKVQQS